MKNDLSFLIMDQMHLYEQQSTYTPNMPLRDLFYVADLLLKKMPLEEAVEKAIEDCVRDNVLREFLLTQRAEVFKMSIYEYDEERELKLIRADERELGKEEERKNTERERREKESALQKVEASIRSMVVLCKEFGSSKNVAVEKLMEKCEMSKDAAEEKVNKYWE